jgi:hypothetical protein
VIKVFRKRHLDFTTDHRTDDAITVGFRNPFNRDEQSTTETETTMNELEAWTHFFSIALNALCTQGQGVSASKGAEELSKQAKEIADEATVQWLSQRERHKEKERHGY